MTIPSSDATRMAAGAGFLVGCGDKTVEAFLLRIKYPAMLPNGLKSPTAANLPADRRHAIQCLNLVLPCLTVRAGLRRRAPVFHAFRQRFGMLQMLFGGFSTFLQHCL